MLYQTTLEQAKQAAADAKRIVISREIYGDLLTPVGVFQRLSAGQSQAVLLDSSDHRSDEDACIYIGLEPFAEFSASQQGIYETIHGQCQSVDADVFSRLREFYMTYKSQPDHTQAKFAGGMIGYMAYDTIRFIESIPDRHALATVPDINFKFYATNVVFDKRSGKVIIAVVAELDADIATCYQRALQKIDRIIANMHQVSDVGHATTRSQTAAATINVDIDDQQFAAIVDKAKAYIRQGDAFQIVLSRCFQRKFSGDDFNVYRAFKVLNPSPYQFYIRDHEFTVVGSSPEKLVSLQNGIVETMPIAGTRPRGADYASDLALENELKNDPKEIAEHMMLVDLGRNDVGMVAKPGTVHMHELAVIKRFSRVMHVTSSVRGELVDHYDAFDVLKSVFPAGTLSGAPKIRAMEIVDELETSRRGIYGGAVCAIDYSGQLDCAITIRTAVIEKQRATVRAGAGIVLDSDPALEAAETRHKAQAVLDALQLAEEGLV